MGYNFKNKKWADTININDYRPWVLKNFKKRI